MRRIMAVAAAGLLLAGPAAGQQQQAPFARERVEWNKPQKPFRVASGIFYVGMAGVSSWLILTLQGLILIDGGLPESAAQIEANIKALGYDIKDVKIILNSHAHFDHAGGLARLKRDSGAILTASAGDAPLLERGRVTFGPSAPILFPRVKVDRVIKDGDTVTLGGVTLTAYVTPGHSPGCTNWTMPIVEGANDHTVLFYCSMTTGGNPLVNNPVHKTIAEDFRTSFKRLKTMQADIFLSAHGEQFSLARKYGILQANEKNGLRGAANPFIDKGEMALVVARQEKAFEEEFKRQQVAAKKP